jgi:hypothetical protein
LTHRAYVFVLSMLGALTGCASAPLPRPSAPLLENEGESIPADVRGDLDRLDRACGHREAALGYDYQEARTEQQTFKTTIGSITGGVGTLSGGIGGVGALVASDKDIKTLTSVTGFVGAGLGAVGTVLTAVLNPGAARMKESLASIERIEAAKKEARASLATKPGSWSGADRDAWKKKAEALSAACK